MAVPQLSLLQRLHERYRDRGLSVLGVALESEPEPILTHVARHGYTFPVVHADPAVGREYEIFRIPRTYLLDHEGVIRSYVTGYSIEGELSLEQDLTNLLSSGVSE